MRLRVVDGRKLRHRLTDDLRLRGGELGHATTLGALTSASAESLVSIRGGAEEFEELDSGLKKKIVNKSLLRKRGD
jgi:hypothetical protein